MCHMMSGQIGLFRINGIAAYQGLFTCVIQDQYEANQTLAVAIYTTNEYSTKMLVQFLYTLNLCRLFVH